MTKEEIQLYAKKYRQNQKVLAIVILSIVILIALILLTVAILLFFQEITNLTYVLASILIVISGIDLFLGIRYMFFSNKKIKYIKDSEAAREYCRIHGIYEKK